ncbi:MAG: adenylate/guanylate cyclase domain-containing protein [Pirellulaceae bacterium]
MQTPPIDELLPRERSLSWNLIPDRMLRAGIAGYPREVRRRLALTNLTGYLAANTSVCYAVVYSIYDYPSLALAIWVNLACAVLYMTLPIWHRFGPFVAPAMFSLVAYGSLFFFVSYLGPDSGIQLNYLGASAVAFILFGTQQYFFWALFVTGGLVLHLLTMYLFPDSLLNTPENALFYRILYGYSAGSIMFLVASVVWYAFRLAREAEERSEQLLQNILPEKIATRLKMNPNELIADRFDEATVLFADLAGFTPKFNSMPAQKMVNLLNEIFCRFDALTLDLNTEKIKTIGDAYLAVSGIPEPNENHAQMIAELALGMMGIIEEISNTHSVDLGLRVGIATGPITAGVIGKAKFAYDVWAPTVNLAARLESHGEIGRIHISDETRRAIEQYYVCEAAQPRELKGIGSPKTWFIVGRK